MTACAPRPASRTMSDDGLCGSDTRDRHAERRAGHVIEACHVEELDRLRIAAVLAADAEPELRVGLAPDPGGQPHEPADARLVDRLERRAVDDLALHVGRDELALDVVAREAQGGLRRGVLAE